jgi:hypothetical protein
VILRAGLLSSGRHAARPRWRGPADGRALGNPADCRGLTFGIITATVGLEQGLFDAQLFTSVLLIVLVSALVPMIALRDIPSELS